MRMSRRAETEPEGPFRTPEQLALAMPLIAMIGLMVVVSAVATGGSSRIVALVAAGGFGLCAIAPMALIRVYVTRPLRGALAQIRAARDGRATEAAFASGVLADLVHLAHDIQAAHANLGASDEVFAQCEKMIAAGEDAVRAFRLQAVGVVAPAVGDALEPEIVALADAAKAMRAAPAAGFDGAVERLEAMLVYIAETLDRVEAKDRQIEGGVGQVEQGVADLARLVARETETLQGEMSSGGLHVRADIAGVVAEEKLGRMRLLERLDALETCLADRAPAPDARLGDDLRALVETVARHVRALAPGAIVDAMQAQRSASEDLRAELGGLSDAVSRLVEAAPAGEALRAGLSRVEAALLGRAQAAVTGLSDLTGLGDDLKALMASVTQLIEDGHADSHAAALEAVGSAGAGLVQFGEVMAERWGAETDAQARRLDAIEGRVVERLVAIGRDNEARTTAVLMRAADGIGEAARRLDAASARAASDDDMRAMAMAVERLAAVEPLAERFDAAEVRMTGGLADVAARFDAFEAWALAGAAKHFGVAQTRIEAAAAKIEAGDPRLAAIAEMTALLQARIGELASDAAALVPAREALADATQRFEAAQTRLADAAAQIEGFAPALAAAPQEIQSRLSRFAETLRAQSGDLAARIDAAQTRLSNAAAAIETGDPRLAETTQAIGALGKILPEVARDLSETQTRWRDLVGDFEAATQQLAALAQTDARDIEALRADFGTAGEAVNAAVTALAVRFDAEAQVEKFTKGLAAQDREIVAALSQTMHDFVGAQKAQDAQDAHTPAVQQALDALRADFASAAATAAERFDAAALNLTRTVEDRVEMLRRGELWPAIAAAQATAQDLHTAHAGLFTHVEALKAALNADRSGFAALRLDVVDAFATVAAIGERADASMREAAVRADAIASSVVQLGGVERAELSAIAQALTKTGQRVEYAARTLEDRRGDLDLPAFAADLTREIDALARAAAERGRGLETGVATLIEDASAALGTLSATAQALDVEQIARKLDGFAQTQDRALRALEGRLAAPAATALNEARDLAARLQDAMTTRERSVVEAVEENTARLDALARLKDERLEGLERRLGDENLAAPATIASSDADGIAALRSEIGLVGETVRAALDRFAASLQGAALADAETRPRGAGFEPKSSGAVAKLVVSMAEALDFRFSNIETALGELTLRMQAPDNRQDEDALDAALAALTLDLRSASQALKSGLSDFVGASAALAQDVARAHVAEAAARMNIAA